MNGLAKTLLRYVFSHVFALVVLFVIYASARLLWGMDPETAWQNTLGIAVVLLIASDIRRDTK